MKTSTHILGSSLIGITVFVGALYFLQKDDPVQMPSKFWECEQIFRVHFMQYRYFYYCPSTGKTWKTGWQEWDRPARYERDRIEHYSEEIEAELKGRPL